MIHAFVQTIDEVLHERSATRHFVSVTVQFLTVDVKWYAVSTRTTRNTIGLQDERFNSPLNTEHIIVVVKVVRLRDWYLMRS